MTSAARTAHRAIPLHAFLASAFLLSSCLYVAPIEEEKVEEKPPYITKQSPERGTVIVTLTDGRDFTVVEYGNDNAEEDFYHRIVLDFRPAGISGNGAVYSSMQRPSEEGESLGKGDPIGYHLSPCAFYDAYPQAIVEGKAVDLYLILSNDEFTHTEEGYSQNVLEPFKTKSGRDVTWVQWTLLFKGACPPPQEDQQQGL